MTPSYQQQPRDLIDGLKAVRPGNALGNDGNEWLLPLLMNGQVHVA